MEKPELREIGVCVTLLSLLNLPKAVKCNTILHIQGFLLKQKQLTGRFYIQQLRDDIHD